MILRSILLVLIIALSIVGLACGLYWIETYFDITIVYGGFK